LKTFNEIQHFRKFKTQAPRFRNQKVFARVVLSSAVFIIVYFTSSKEKTSTLAGIKEVLSLREHKVECSPESYPSCLPPKCGRFVSDNVISELELAKFREIASDIFRKILKSNGESSVTFDLHSKALLKSESISKNVEELLKVKQKSGKAFRFQNSSCFSLFNQSSLTHSLTDLKSPTTLSLSQVLPSSQESTTSQLSSLKASTNSTTMSRRASQSNSH
jgi:hypothetical protein